MYQTLRESVLVFPKEVRDDGRGGRMSQAGSARRIWAHVATAQPLADGFHQVRGQGARSDPQEGFQERYDVTIRAQAIQGPLARLAWKGQTLAPLTAPQLRKNPAYASFQAVLVKHAERAHAGA